MGRRTEIGSGESDWDQGADSADFETVLSPLSIYKDQKRIPGAYVQKDVCSPREVSYVPREVACDGNWLRIGQPVSISWEKSAEGILMPVNELGEKKSREVADWQKARTVPPAEWWG